MSIELENDKWNTEKNNRKFNANAKLLAVSIISIIVGVIFAVYFC